MDILAEFINRLPMKQRHTPSGWRSFNAVCCVHRGHKADRRGRAGFKLSGDGGFSYSCFNCSFKASWVPGRSLSHNARQLLSFMGTTKEEISKIAFHCMKTKSKSTDSSGKQIYTQVKKVELPQGAKPFSEWVENPPEDFLNVLSYLNDRNPNLIKWHNFYWTPEKEYNMNKRFIIPFISDGGWVYGYSARAVSNNILPKYMASVSSNSYIFGQENLYKPNRKFVILCEGILDAISISGCAVMKQYISDNQKETLKTTDKKIIVVPDRDASGKQLVNQAIELGYAVSFPNWGEDIKDISDAVAKYGRLATLEQILESIEDSGLKIKLKAKGWFNV